MTKNLWISVIILGSQNLKPMNTFLKNQENNYNDNDDDNNETMHSCSYFFKGFSGPEKCDILNMCKHLKETNYGAKYSCHRKEGMLDMKVHQINYQIHATMQKEATDLK